ncbi:4773_t:CDS:2 [Funneliformis geosporum]|uniref:6457_t:CDS:1 n=1 Tax=Funneliformis geosporum TaxID=1117311 RepID=A0A9W4SEC5_9GLOM|nr:6457_t:CDS:2 [Funneliformis geosporum]CAI2183009.1 4773_t:CDS:2 [Funneliformis geosporum]
MEGLKISRETRQSSKIKQIDESLLTRDRNQNIVKIIIPELDKADTHVHDAIHDVYNAQIIDNDIYIKYDGEDKSTIYRLLANSAAAHNPNWHVNSNEICVAGNNDYRPDVSVWFQRPTFLKRQNPIRNSHPLPNVWIEIFYNRDLDREKALHRITLAQRHNPRIEFVGMALPELVRPFPQNPNPWIDSVPVTRENDRPNQAPYLIHWNANTNPVYFKINWNEHLVLRCGWILELNNVLNTISIP